MEYEHIRYLICPDSSNHGYMTEEEITHLSRYLENQVVKEGKAIIPPNWIVSFKVAPEGNWFKQYFEFGGVFYRIYEDIPIDF